MKLRTLFAMLIIVALLLNLFGCGGQSAAMSDAFTEAIESGIAWEALAAKADKALTAKDAVSLMTNTLEVMDSPDAAAYLDTFSKAHSNSEKVTRIRLAELLWCTYVDVVYGDGQYFNGPHSKDERISASAISYTPRGSYEEIGMSVDEDAVYASSDDGFTVVNYVICAYDRTNGDKLMPLYDDNTFRPNDTVTVEEAVGVFLRFSRSIEPAARYADPEDAGTHTIDSSLYTGETSLPDASNQDLPQWQGFNISMESMLPIGCLASNPDAHSYEAEIAYIRELGGNFAHIYLSWSWLQGPDYACDSRVNLTRLEQLDSVIAACMKHDVHLQLVFNDVPNFDPLHGSTMDDWFAAMNTVFTDPDVRDTVTRFWRMLAKRYADIPNNYLSFNLMNECAPADDAVYAWGFSDAVAAIWEESPDRVIVADVHSGNITGETMAELGCALSFHLYEPRQIAMVQHSVEEASPGYYENLQWPILQTAAIMYGPEGKDTFPALAGKPAALTGNLGGAQMHIALNDISMGQEVIRITADGKVLYEGTPAHEYLADQDLYFPTEAIDITIPEGTEAVEISCKKGYAFSINAWTLDYPDGTQINLYPNHDGWNGMNYVNVRIADDYTLSGTAAGAPVNGFDFAETKAGLVSINDLIAIGKAYGVDVMIGECGIFEEATALDFGISHETATAFLRDEIELFQGMGLAWAYELYGRYSPLTPAPYLADTTYKKMEGMPYYANEAMDAFFRDILN